MKDTKIDFICTISIVWTALIGTALAVSVFDMPIAYVNIVPVVYGIALILQGIGAYSRTLRKLGVIK
jgi:hypothetical protein